MAGYTKIKNNHIFVQIDSLSMHVIRHICSRKDMRHQNLHIFELNPVSVQTDIEVIINWAGPHNKVIIHVPYYVRDYERLLRKYLEGEGVKGNYRIVIDKKPVEFYATKPEDALVNISDQNKLTQIFKVEFAKDHNNYKIRTWLECEYDRYVLPKWFYDPTWKYFGSKPQQDDPELFKDRIIQYFRKTCNRRIRNTTFHNNDDEIWGYIVSEVEYLRNKLSEKDKEESGDGESGEGGE